MDTQKQSFSRYQIQRKESIWPHLLLTEFASFRVPKTTLGFDNQLEGFTELTENCYPHSYGLSQQEDTDESQPKKKAHRAESRKI